MKLSSFYNSPLFGAFVLAILAGWWFLVPSVDRYRVTIKIETPDGIKTGSSVIEVIGYRDRSGESCGGTPCATSAGRISGVAPIVDLGKHGMIIGSLSGMLEYLGPTPPGPGPFKGLATNFGVGAARRDRF